jgi:ketosteroid isomerase-like protein
MHSNLKQSRRYAKKGDEKPYNFKVGDLIVYRNGETAMVTKVFDLRAGSKSKYTEWTLHLMWTSGKNGDTLYREADYHELYGISRTNMFNILSIDRGPHLYPVEE